MYEEPHLLNPTTLASLKERGDRALAETRLLIEDMAKFATDMRREALTMRWDIGPR